PETNLVFYGTANPSTWNPVQRAGTDGKPIDQKWTMAIIARDADTGVAKWAYQMTPFDEWDYDGVNEMILADIDVKGQKRKALVHFDRNGLGYTLDRVTGELLVADKFDPAVNWTTGVVMDKNNPQYGRPQVVKQYSTFQTCQDKNTKGVCRPALQAPRPGRFSAADQPVLRPHHRRLKGFRAVPGVLHGRSALCRRDAVDVPGPREPRRHGQLHCLGCRSRQDRLVETGAVLRL